MPNAGSNRLWHSDEAHDATPSLRERAWRTAPVRIARGRTKRFPPAPNMEQ